MIREIDHKIYNRYKDGHDGTMDKYIEWYERGGRQSLGRNRTKRKSVFKCASDIIKTLRKRYTAPQIAKMVGIGQNLVYQLQADNHNCSREKAQQIANFKLEDNE